MGRSLNTDVRTVLICEDDPVQARLVRDGLTHNGWYVVGPCATPEEGERMAQEPSLCAALLDVELEGGSSIGVAKILIERGIPFAFVTSHGPTTAATLRSFSDRLVVPKPVTSDLLHEILQSLLGQPTRPAVAS